MELAAYENAWNIYLICAACILLAQLTFLWVFPKRWVFFLMAVSAVVMVLPYQAGDNVNWKTPAVAVFFIDHFLLKGTQWSGAMYSIIKAIAFTVLAFVLFLLGLMLKDHYFPKEQNNKDQDHDSQQHINQDDDYRWEHQPNEEQDAYAAYTANDTRSKKSNSKSNNKEQKYTPVKGAYATEYLDLDDSFSALDDDPIPLSYYSHAHKKNDREQQESKNSTKKQTKMSSAEQSSSNDEAYNHYYSNSNYYHSFSPLTLKSQQQNLKQKHDALKNYYIASNYYASPEKSIESARQKSSGSNNLKNEPSKDTTDDDLLVIPLND